MSGIFQHTRCIESVLEIEVHLIEGGRAGIANSFTLGTISASLMVAT